MAKWARRLIKTIIILAVIAIPVYYALVVHSPSPSEAEKFSLDIGAIRELANKPGVRPYEIRVEKVGEFEFAEAMVMAGEPWKGTPIPVYSYQLIFPGKTIIVDTAMASLDGMPEAFVTGFDEAAYQRMNAAMEKAAQIIVTHEHFDHIAGILEHPNLAQILPAVKLTREQINNPDGMLPSLLPEGLFDDYQPLEYEGMHAIAPGVVLIKAPGHTPGSQMVYVRLADGREVLLLGDVAWQSRNIHAVKERPLFMTAMIKENREQVINQFQALHDLQEMTPEVRQLPGHEETVANQLIEQGYLTLGFR